MTVIVGDLQPSYITIDPTTGATGASFTGHVHAAGLDLDAGTTATPPDTDRVRWIRLADGAVVAELYGYSAGGTETLQLRAKAAAATDVSIAQLVAADDLGTAQAGVVAQQDARGITALTGVSAFAVGQNIAIINGLGQSNFLLINGTKFSSAGTGSVTWPGASINSSIVNITVPGASGNVIALVCSYGGGVAGFGQPIFGAADNANGTFAVQSTTPNFNPPAATVQKFAWIAWGL